MSRLRESFLPSGILIGIACVATIVIGSNQSASGSAIEALHRWAPSVLRLASRTSGPTSFDGIVVQNATILLVAPLLLLLSFVPMKSYVERWMLSRQEEFSKSELLTSSIVFLLGACFCIDSFFIEEGKACLVCASQSLFRNFLFRGAMICVVAAAIPAAYTYVKQASIPANTRVH